VTDLGVEHLKEIEFLRTVSLPGPFRSRRVQLDAAGRYHRDAGIHVSGAGDRSGGRAKIIDADGTELKGKEGRGTRLRERKEEMTPH
jgi:hypothetical protein